MRSDITRQSIESYSLPLHFDAENADADTSGICAPIRATSILSGESREFIILQL